MDGRTAWRLPRLPEARAWLRAGSAGVTADQPLSEPQGAPEEAFPCALLQGCAVSSPCPCWASLDSQKQTPRASPLLLLPRAWVQPCMVAALLLETPPWLSVHGQAGAGSWPRSHSLSRAVAQVSPAAVTCCWPALGVLQRAHHRCLQQTSAVPACGHPGSGTRCQSHHL